MAAIDEAMIPHPEPIEPIKFLSERFGVTGWQRT